MSTRMWFALVVLPPLLWGCSYQPGTADSVIRADLAPQSVEGFIDLRGTPRPLTEVLVVEQDGPTIDLSRVGRSAELPHGGSLNTRHQDRIVPLPLRHTDIKAQLTLYLSSVTVTQRYHNPYSEKIEAVYVFPLPDDAGVRDFVMQIGDRSIRGIIREREEARRIYLEARHQGYVASLLTQQRANVFTQAVANIEPGKAIDIQITYYHVLRYHEGTFEFVFPMVVGPRYNPPGFPSGVGAAPAGAPGRSSQETEVQYLPPGEISPGDIGLEVNLQAAAELGEVASPTHVLRVERPAPSRARVTLSPNDRVPNRDFVLRYRLRDSSIRASLATFRDATGNGYFTLMVEPPPRLADVPSSPREMVFVIDCSGSMTGRPLDVAKRALSRCLKRLSPDDTFQIIQFSDRYSSLESTPLPATPANVDRGLRYVDRLTAGGGTEMQDVVRVALDAPPTPGRYRIVSIMTDGFIGNDREVVAFARGHLGSSRIFSFGVGDSVNRYLLEALARVGRGVSAFITLDEATERAADELYQRVEHPALQDLKINWGMMGVSDLEPGPLPDLFVGRPVILTGRFKAQGPARVQISGRAGREPFEISLDVDLDAPALHHPALPVLWARSRITTLCDQAFASSDSREQALEIRRLALTYGILSEYTAFVAVDSLSRTTGQFGTTVVQPVNVPSGVKYETTVEKK